MKISKKATTIAVINQKGGTGKTTTCENLGVGLAMEGKKVLLVDADPQGSLTVSMGWQDPDALPTTLSTLMQKAMNDQCIPPGEGILHHAEGVDLIPANIELAGLEVALVNTMSREKVMKQVLESAKREYDYILIDCTPSLGMLTVNALAAADSALIPVQAQYLSAKGLEQLLQTVQKVRRQINPKLKIEGMHYNPFAYVHSEKDILKLVTTLMTNTKGEGNGGDPFWEKSERLLLTALIAYLHYEAPVEEQNFATLLEMLNTMQVLEDDEEYQNPVDLLFEELAKKKPNSFAGRQYKLYKLAAGKTAKSILISCGARLAPFDIQELRDLTMYDELQLDTLGDKKTALFLIMSDTDSTFNFLISMVYTQLFNLLCDKADDVYGGKLPIHVRCLIDECANIGQIPNLEKLVATIRSREISACLVLQARSQLKAIYKDNADTIVGNMDSQIFLGGSEPTTLKDLSEMLGKETIDAFNTSDTRGNSPSYGTTFQKMGHELLSRDELAVLDGGKCILQLRGVRPFLSDKYDLTQHPNYKLTSDYDPKNTFDIEKYLNRKEKIHPADEFIVVDADSLPPA